MDNSCWTGYDVAHEGEEDYSDDDDDNNGNDDDDSALLFSISN